MLSHGGFIVFVTGAALTTVSSDPPLWLWMLHLVGVAVFVAGEFVEGGETRAERAQGRWRDRERWAFEQRRWEAARVAAAEAELAAETARTRAALIAVEKLRR
ncbi:hypothetical protein [Mumia quercus]|uniref:hypothetical protein n=1 Tax=Mumia quercus TaxID=2976125 RepID=UPI0021D2839A|nr:hypothetical protein [Mumia quercus]